MKSTEITASRIARAARYVNIHRKAQKADNKRMAVKIDGIDFMVSTNEVSAVVRANGVDFLVHHGRGAKKPHAVFLNARSMVSIDGDDVAGAVMKIAAKLDKELAEAEAKNEHNKYWKDKLQGQAGEAECKLGESDSARKYAERQVARLEKEIEELEKKLLEAKKPAEAPAPAPAKTPVPERRSAIRPSGPSEVRAPYNSRLVEQCRKLGGKWTGSCWEIPARAADEAADLNSKFNDTVAIVATAERDASALTGPILICGVPVAQAYGRDSGAKVGKSASMTSGSISSGGSAKNWLTKASEGSSFKLSVPRHLIEIEDYDYEWAVEEVKE